MTRILYAIFLLAAWALGGCGAISRLQYADACKALDIHPADAEEVEPRRFYMGPGESTTANLMLKGTVQANWDFYSKAYVNAGWTIRPDSELPAARYGTPVVEGTLKVHRGFEDVWVDLREVSRDRTQAMQHFSVEQPSDRCSRMLQSAWNNLFHWLPPDNPVRQAKCIF